MIPGITGLDSMRALAEDPDFGLPIIAHPAILGAMLGGGTPKLHPWILSRCFARLVTETSGCGCDHFPQFRWSLRFQRGRVQGHHARRKASLWRTTRASYRVLGVA